MEDNFNLAPNAQHIINLILIWLGFGTLVALSVRALLPGREPNGFMSTIIIGVLGTFLGPLIVSSIWRIENFNPISPIGFLAAFSCAFLCLLFYQIGYAMLRKHRNEYD